MNSKKLGILILVVLEALVGGVLLLGGSGQEEESTLGSEVRSQIIKNVTPKEAQALIQNNKGNEDFIILDLRCIKEYIVGHIEGSINLNYFAKSFPEEFNKLDKDKTYLIYCRTGKVSKEILDEMKVRGFREVYNLSGGIVSWQSEGLLVTK